NKAPAKVTKDKGIDLLSDVTLLEATQLKKALKESKQETHKVHDSGSSDQDDESNDDSDDDNDYDNKDDDSKNDDDGDSDADDSEKTDSDDDENPKFTVETNKVSLDLCSLGCLDLYLG
ncbi:hypothetical protein Tco_0362426, partial [Tanacetum coccineum]